jgi:hypothetical protein
MSNANGKQELERLTHAWYGCVVAASALGFFFMGRGIIGAAIGLLISLTLVTIIGRKLAGGSNATRLFCIVVSGLGLLGNVAGVYHNGMALFGYFSFFQLAVVALGAIYVWMSIRSLRVMFRNDVRKHCA